MKDLIQLELSEIKRLAANLLEQDLFNKALSEQVRAIIYKAEKIENYQASLEYFKTNPIPDITPAPTPPPYNPILDRKIADFLTSDDIIMYLNEEPSFADVLDQTVKQFITIFQSERSEPNWQAKLNASGDYTAQKIASQKANVAEKIGFPVDPITTLRTFPDVNWVQAVPVVEEVTKRSSDGLTDEQRKILGLS